MVCCSSNWPLHLCNLELAVPPGFIRVMPVMHALLCCHASPHMQGSALLCRLMQSNPRCHRTRFAQASCPHAWLPSALMSVSALLCPDVCSCPALMSVPALPCLGVCPCPALMSVPALPQWLSLPRCLSLP